MRLHLCKTITHGMERSDGEIGTDFVFISGNESEHGGYELYDKNVVVPKNLVVGKKGWFRVVGRYRLVIANSMLREKRLIVSDLIPYTPNQFSFLYIQKFVSVNLPLLQNQIKTEYYYFLRKIFPSEFASLMTSMALGKPGAPENKELKDIMRLSGLSHVLAVSGLHINFVFYGLFRMLLRLMDLTEKITKSFVKNICTKFGLSVRRSYNPVSGWFLVVMKAISIFCLLTLFLFVIFAGISASSLRAFLLLLIISINRNFLHINLSRFLVLLLIMIALLFYNPYYAIDPAFLLSFSVSFGFVFFNLLKKHFLAKYSRLSKFFLNLLSLFVPFLFSGLITLFFFNELNLVGIFSNFLLLWAVPFILVLAYLFFFIFVVNDYFLFKTPILSVLMEIPLTSLSLIYLQIMKILGSFSWSVLSTQNRLNLMWLGSFYLLILIFFYLFLFRKGRASFEYSLERRWDQLCC